MGARDELHGHDPGPPPLLPPPSPHTHTHTHQPELFSRDEEPGGERPDQLFAVSGPQARVQRRTVQQIIDFALLPTLDDPVPQMVEQLPDVLQFVDALIPDPDQVIEVPKILPEDFPLRAVCVIRSW